jgi:hypothetical protein
MQRTMLSAIQQQQPYNSWSLQFLIGWHPKMVHTVAHIHSFKLILKLERALEIPIVTEVKGDDGLVPVRPAANDAYKVCIETPDQ